MKKRDLLDHFSQTTSWEFNSSYQKVFKEKYLNQTTALLKKKKFLVCEEFFQNGERAIAALCQKCGHKKIYTGYSYPRECPSCRTKNSGLTLGVIEESNEDFAKILLFNVAPEFTIPPLVVSDPFDCLYSAEVTGAKLVGNYTRFVFSWRYGLFSVPFEQELHRVIIHGIHHLLGQGDKTEEEATAMRKKENDSLALWETMN